MENSTILIDWGDRPDTRPPVRVITRRAMLLPQDGTLQHVDDGTVVTLDAGILDGLSPCDFERLPDLPPPL